MKLPFSTRRGGWKLELRADPKLGAMGRAGKMELRHLLYFPRLINLQEQIPTTLFPVRQVLDSAVQTQGRRRLFLGGFCFPSLLEGLMAVSAGCNCTVPGVVGCGPFAVSQGVGLLNEYNDDWHRYSLQSKGSEDQNLLRSQDGFPWFQADGLEVVTVPARRQRKLSLPKSRHAAVLSLWLSAAGI
ncbi:hypothetical protein BJX63DRAFT_46748 [Aspergillus granulosus]|uniref:Uncharacterized protein n=1 Tax=Aspergillus granulosus TaxID=176169 RepID=A0ABR4HTW8_9EURO